MVLIIKKNTKINKIKYIGLVTSTTNVTSFLNENVSVKKTKETIFNNPFETNIIRIDDYDGDYLELNSNNINMTDNNDNGNTKNVEKEDSESDWSDISDENDDIIDELNNGNLYFYFKINFHQVKILNPQISKTFIVNLIFT